MEDPIRDSRFRTWSADVKSLLRERGNELQVEFASPIKVALPMWEATPWRDIIESGNDQSANGGVFNARVGVFVRKAGYHFGWDWGPRLVTSGIWKPVYIESWDDAMINNVHYTQTSVTAKEAVIDVVVEIVADHDVAGAVLKINNATDRRTEVTKKVSLTKGLNKIPLTFRMRNPRLGWTAGLGEQFLYDFSTELSLGGGTIDSEPQKLGIRSLRVVVEPDKYGESFYFELNGHPVFAKGSNYIPCDNFLPRVTEAIYEKTIQDAVAANMNMLRVWGGGIYENDVFYDLCDKYGILVWQDFMFSCALYPSEGELLENIRQEAIENVRRLRNHTCLAIWCGNNECLDMWFKWGVKRRYDRYNPEWSARVWKQFTDLYFDVLPAVVAEHQPGIAYRKSSPYADDMGTRTDSIGDYHYWDVWGQGLELDLYNKVRSRFFSEYGFQSFPEFSSIKRFAPQHRDWAVTSEVMMSHQRGGARANERIAAMLERDYGVPSDFESFTYMSQLLQADAMKIAMEAHRRDMPFCMGSLLWQMNDCWPVASWSGRDWYGRWKAMHYFTAHAFDDILISPIEEDGNFNVYVVSDRLKPAEGELIVTAMDMEGRTLARHSIKKKIIPANTSTNVFILPIWAVLPPGLKHEGIVVNVTFIDANGKTYQNNYFPAKHKDMEYRRANITTDIVAAEGGFDVTLSADKFVRGAFIHFDDGGSDREVNFVHRSSLGVVSDFVSDNFVDIIPGHPVTVHVSSEMSVEEARGRIRIITLETARKTLSGVE